MVSYADKPWTKTYDPGVPTTLKPYPDVPVYHFLQEGAKKYGDRPFAIATAKIPVAGRLSKNITYKDVDDASDAFAVALGKLGVKKGDAVAIIMPNCAQFIISFFGILKAGGVVVAINPTYPPDKLEHQINDAGAKVVITLSLFYKMVVDFQPKTKLQHVVIANIKEYLPAPAKLLFTLAKEKKDGHYVEKRPQDHWFQELVSQNVGQKPNVKITKDDLALFQYTGGTTGVSKAAMATHGALVANTLMAKAWLFGKEDPKEDIMLGAIPMFHVFGLVAVLCLASVIGSRIVLVPNPRDITEVLDCIDHYGCTLFHGVPALYNAINNHADVKSGKFKLKSIRYCLSGSAPLAPATKEEFEKITGGILVEGFGMSECPTATHVNPLRGENRTGSIGLPLPDMEIKIVSLDDPDQEMPPGEVGEMLVHGPQIMLGYYNMPTETQNVLREDKDGKKWMMTGDIARMDEQGYFYIVDRKKDMALIGGFNVYPRVVEDVLMEHPGVSEVGVAAVPHKDKVGQEMLKAWIVAREGHTLTEKELIEFAEKKLARYEVPTRFEFVKELPRTTVGKVLRRELARMEIEAREKA